MPRFKEEACILEFASYDLRSSWKFPFHDYDNEDDADEAWLSMEQSFRKRLNDEVLAWLETDTFSSLSEQEKYFLHRRFFKASGLLHQLEREDGYTVFPFPQMSQKDFRKWMLIEWWDFSGRLETMWEDGDEPKPFKPGHN